MTGADSWQAHHVGFFDLPSELWMNVAAARLDFQCRRPPLAVRLFPYVYLDHSLVSSTALQCLRRKVFCVVPGPGQSEGRWGYGEVSVTPPPPSPPMDHLALVSCLSPRRAVCRHPPLCQCWGTLPAMGNTAVSVLGHIACHGQHRCVSVGAHCLPRATPLCQCWGTLPAMGKRYWCVVYCQSRSAYSPVHM